MNADPPAPPACAICADPTFVALAQALAEDDLDRALASGLLTFEAPAARCAICATRVDAILAARDARRRALAARERFRARETRLAERAAARARRRAAAAMPTANAPAAADAPARPALPPAAAAALARARAKAAAKRSE